MKALDTDAVRKLYRGKIQPNEEEPEINSKALHGIEFRITLAFAAITACTDEATGKLLEAVSHDVGLLYNLAREDGFVCGFRYAVELLEKGELK